MYIFVKLDNLRLLLSICFYYFNNPRTGFYSRHFHGSQNPNRPYPPISAPPSPLNKIIDFWSRNRMLTSCLLFWKPRTSVRDRIITVRVALTMDLNTSSTTSDHWPLDTHGGMGRYYQKGTPLFVWTSYTSHHCTR